MKERRLLLSGNIEQVTSTLLALIAKHGDVAKVMDVIVKERGNDEE